MKSALPRNCKIPHWLLESCYEHRQNLS